MKNESKLEIARTILRESQKEKEPYTFRVHNKEIIIYPDVFSPKYFDDTLFFLDSLPFLRGCTILEIGSGTGIISLFYAFKGASKVVACDINSVAVNNTQANIDLHGLGEVIEVVESDVFDAVNEGDFDIIFWNLPFCYAKEKVPVEERTIIDPFYNSLHKFFEGLENRLKEGGRAFLGFSTTMGNFEMLNALTQQSGHVLEVVTQKKAVRGHLEISLELFEVKR